MLAGRLSRLRSLRRGYLHAFSIPRQGCGCVSQVCNLLMMWRQGIIGYRGQILHFLDDPKAVREDKTSFVLFLIDEKLLYCCYALQCGDVEKSYEFFEDGILVVQNGKILHCGSATQALLAFGQSLQIKDCSKYLIMPG